MSKAKTFAEWLNEEPGRLIIIKPGVDSSSGRVSFYCYSRVAGGRKVFATVEASIEYLMIPAVGEMIVGSVETSIADLLAGDDECGVSKRTDEIMEDDDASE